MFLPLLLCLLLQSDFRLQETCYCEYPIVHLDATFGNEHEEDRRADARIANERQRQVREEVNEPTDEQVRLAALAADRDAVAQKAVPASEANVR